MKVLVTGGTSLIGRCVIDRLVGRGDRVVALQRSQVEIPDADTVAGAITNLADVQAAVEGCDAVVHLAARVGILGTFEEFHHTNVEGTEVVLESARSAGVKRFVYVSSPSVAHGGEALVAAGAAPADPESTSGHYSTTKALAEGYALSRHSDQMAVTAIRPHLVWGPGDTQLVARIVDRARSGRLAMVGSGAALIDSTYIDNAADALVAAIDRCEAAGGEALVVSNGEPRPIADLTNGILAAHGLPPVGKKVPKRVAYGAGWLIERAWDRLPLPDEPPMTTFLAEQLGTAHWFDQTRTREVLQWTPAVSLDEGLKRLAEHVASSPDRP